MHIHHWNGEEHLVTTCTLDGKALIPCHEQGSERVRISICLNWCTSNHLEPYSAIDHVQLIILQWKTIINKFKDILNQLS